MPRSVNLRTVRHPSFDSVSGELQNKRRRFAMTSLSTVTFHNHELITIQHDGKPYVAMKPIVEAIGLDWRSQLQRIKRHPILSASVVIITTQLENDSQRREISFLPLSMLNGWLFGVDANRVKPEIRETLLTYQRECFDALNDYWNKGAAINPRKTLTPEMQRHVQELVNDIRVRHGIHWATTYNRIKSAFKVGSYKDVLAKDYPALCTMLGEPNAGCRGDTLGIGERFGSSMQGMANTRWMVAFDHNGKRQIRAIENNEVVMSPSKMLSEINKSCGIYVPPAEIFSFIITATEKLKQIYEWQSKRAALADKKGLVAAR